MRRTKEKSKKLNLIKPVILVIVVAICVLIFLIPNVFSKYVIQSEEIYLQQAEDFYFESNISGETYSLNDWDISEDYVIDFSVINYENNLLYTTSDIIYNIGINVLDEEGNSTNAISVLIQDSDNNKVSGTQTLTGGMLSENTYSLVISSNSANKGDTFKIELTIQSTSPYEKSLTAIFDITAEEDNESYVISLTELDEKEYDILTITTYEIDEDVIFTYDNTKYTLDGSAGISQGASIVEDEETTTVTILDENFENYSNYTVYLIKIT